MRFVLPGDRIGSSEEFFKGNGVYEEQGELYAAIAGWLVIKDKRVEVKGINRLAELEDGDVVLGKVVDVRQKFALVEIDRKKGVDRDLVRKEVITFSAPNLRDFVGMHDVVKGRVKGNRLLFEDSEMGVLKAICSFCRSEMIFEDDKLKCPVCGSVEKRKVSKDYRRGVW